MTDPYKCLRCTSIGIGIYNIVNFLYIFFLLTNCLDLLFCTIWYTWLASASSKRAAMGI